MKKCKGCKTPCKKAESQSVDVGAFLEENKELMQDLAKLEQQEKEEDEGKADD
jgi:hypothetical protein